MATVIAGDFEWDQAKAEQNLSTHGVAFEEAATVFADPDALYLDDGSGIGRFAIIGTSIRTRVLLVIHVGRGKRDRIISARQATRTEEALYGERYTK